MKADNNFDDLISVIIPVYNSEKYIKKCLDSIINQTYKNLQIIIIDDASVDNSRKIIKSYCDDRIIFVCQNHCGVSAARNKGLQLAKGDYIGFVDSDDWIDVDFYEKLHKAVSETNADIGECGIVRLSKTSKKYFLKFDKRIITDDIRRKLEISDIPDKCYIWNKLYKVDLLKQNNLKFTENRVYEDVLFTPQCICLSNKLVTVPDTYYYYCRHAGSIVKNQSTKFKEDYKLMSCEAENFLKNYGIDMNTLPKTVVKKYKMFGLTLFKTKQRGNEKVYFLFSIFKFKKHIK